MSKVLLIIDMQRFVEDRITRDVGYYPPDAIHNMACILNKFRANKWLVAHVIHQSQDKNSFLNPESLYSSVMTDFEHNENEAIFIKHTSSAFASTDLKKYLDDNVISEVVVIGAVAGFCVNSTVRHGADLGIKMKVVKDAVISFDLKEEQKEAKLIHDVTMSLLASDFASIISLNEI